MTIKALRSIPPPTESSRIFDGYGYHEAGISMKLGMPSLWNEKHDLYVEFNGYSQATGEQVENWVRGKGFSGQKTLPSYYQEVEWLPGYTYYYNYKTPRK